VRWGLQRRTSTVLYICTHRLACAQFQGRWGYRRVVAAFGSDILGQYGEFTVCDGDLTAAPSGTIHVGQPHAHALCCLAGQK
jgi:hypothetical protein